MMLKIILVAVIACVIGIILGEFKFGSRLLAPVITGHLVKQKEKSLSAPSPFEGVDPSTWLMESEHAYVIKDKYPLAPLHLLVIPKKRLRTLNEAPTALLGEMMALAIRAAAEYGVEQSGYRLVVNTNPQGMQTVYHLHIHILGGRQLNWPAG